MKGTRRHRRIGFGPIKSGDIADTALIIWKGRRSVVYKGLAEEDRLIFLPTAVTHTPALERKGLLFLVLPLATYYLFQSVSG